MENSKLEDTNTKETLSTKGESAKKYDLEERTVRFAKTVLQYVKTLPKTVPNQEITRQLVRAAGSVGANYIEASESLGTKDFRLHMKISRKEAKEARFWLALTESDVQTEKTRNALQREALELTKIFSAIVRNTAHLS